jgi:hypothetical protein
MKYAWLHSIDEAAFMGCLSAPTEEQVECVARHLVEADFRSAPWAADPRAWTVQRFAAPDWYSDLDVGEPDAWEGAILRLIERPEFDLRHEHAGTVGTLSCYVIDWSDRAFARLGEPAVLRHFKPYRYFLSGERELELMWGPAHAMLASAEVGRLLSELARFEEVLGMRETARSEVPPGMEDLAATLRRFGIRGAGAPEIEEARQSVAEAVPVLEEIRAQGRMLFAPFET